ncbi:MAG: hypothetical protein KME55_13570 [Nostoc indistinguendum CM1-VF10]|nr:hypothetical protein [Nostoc indistinguendum CM1-VF10]
MTVKTQNESSFLKPEKRISKSAKSVLAKGMRKRLKNSDQVATKAIDILKNNMTAKVLDPNSTKRSNQEKLFRTTAITIAATKAPTNQTI